MADQPAIRKVPGSSRRVRYSAAPAEDKQTEDKQTPPEPPQRAVENTDRAWGDAVDSNDERLKNDRPPHWG